MIIAYIYNHTGSSELAQFFYVQSLEITEQISEVSTALFHIPVLHPNGQARENISREIFQEFNRVTITKTEHNRERVLFRGYIHSVENTWDTIRVSIYSPIGLLAYRILKNSLDFQGATGTNVVNICATQTGANSLFTFSANVPEHMKKRYEIGKSMLDILKDISSA